MRLEGWEQRLDSVISAQRTKTYELGKEDCFRLACRVVECLTGIDRWPEFAGYKTRDEAIRAIAKHGSSFEEAGDWFFSAERVSTGLARRGDIVAMQTQDGEKHLAVCLGSRCAGYGPDGLMFFPTSLGLCAWRVG